MATKDSYYNPGPKLGRKFDLAHSPAATMAGLILLDIAVAVFGVILVRKIFTKPSNALPPGPSRLPLLGNLLDMPTSQEWVTFAEWGKKWGDMVTISILGQPMIIVNSAKTAMEMLNKKSAIYSDRPIVPMGGELVGWKDTLVLIPFGERHRSYRKLFHQVIGSNASMSLFYPVEEFETHLFLKSVLKNPGELVTSIRKTAGAIIMRIAYGYHVKERNDPFLAQVNEAVDQFSLSTAPGGFMVNLVPSLRHLPAWFPGAGFKQTAALWAQSLITMVEQPHQLVKQQMAAGTAESSFTSRFLDDSPITAEQEHDIKWSAASLYSGGADTTVSAIHAFFLAMTLYPDVARKAQEELDAVVGQDRLPSFSDRESLPYINALVLEVLRWHSVTPTGVTHRAMEDNVHDGYVIPKGTLIIPNIWFMLHDPKVYPNPSRFDPERFYGPQRQQDPLDICFGFGRRICPGRVLADSSLFITCAMTLAVFDITKYSQDGVVVEPIIEQTTGTISHPKPFKCSIKPRSQKALDLISVDADEL
ncbi:cytochrome P450 [Phlegmacium glaucopus]|nr:cytochrome P450 [Phlegmacium glaucopus]